MNYTFFWSGPFSQWEPSEFQVSDVKYSHAEQYMMASKARLFGDDVTLAKIMKSNNPREQKFLGKQIQGFIPDVWNEHCRNFVYDGNWFKFSQNENLKDALRKTIGTMMVEASPKDVIWGIGIGPDDPARLDEANWKGTNYLGQVITLVRKAMFSDPKDQQFNFNWPHHNVPGQHYEHVYRKPDSFQD